MSRKTVNIVVLNDTVGIPQSSDGIMMMFIKALANVGQFALDTAYLLTKPSDLDALGIDAEYDSDNNLAVFQQVTEFYAEAGEGALLWLVGKDHTTAFVTYVASDTFKDLVRATATNDPDQQAKMIGICYEVPTALQAATDFPADVSATRDALDVVQGVLFDEGYRISFVLDGYNMSSAVSQAALGTQANAQCPSVSMCITGLQGNGVSGVGFALGRFSRISVGHGFGAVEDGKRNTQTAFLTNSILLQAGDTLTVGDVCTVYGGAITYNSVVYQVGQKFTVVGGHTLFTTTAGGWVIDNATPVQSIRPSDIDQLGDKQYMFLRTWRKRTGFYWNDAATCEDPAKALSTQEFQRVANKLSDDADFFFTNEIGKNLVVDTKTGDLDQTYCAGKQGEFYKDYIAPISAVNNGTGDLSDASIVVTGPAFLANKKLNFKLTISPTPILGDVDGIVEFSATL